MRLWHLVHVRSVTRSKARAENTFRSPHSKQNPAKLDGSASSGLQPCVRRARVRASVDPLPLLLSINGARDATRTPRRGSIQAERGGGQYVGLELAQERGALVHGESVQRQRVRQATTTALRVLWAACDHATQYNTMQ
jgi:hypothetical protein